MDKDTYIKQLEKENAELKQQNAMLEKRIEQLEHRLGMNSGNSSKPLSSDPPGTSSNKYIGTFTSMSLAAYIVRAVNQI